MTASHASLLEVLGECLGAGVAAPDALSRIEAAGPEARRWVERLRPLISRTDASLAGSLLLTQAIDAEEHAILAEAAAPEAVGRLLRAFALRRRRRASLRDAVLGGLVGPFAVAALTVVLGPLPNLLGTGSYVGPVARGLFALGVVTALVVSAPAALRSARLGPPLLGVCARVPGLAWVAARYAEGELVSVSAPFVDVQHGVGGEGLRAASAMLAWSPLGGRVRAVAGVTGTTTPQALARLAPHLSLATNLVVVGGAASGELPARLAARGEAIALDVSARLRRGARVAAYAVVVVASFGSLADLVSRGLPGMPLLPGATPSAEQKELDDLLRQLDSPHAAPPP